MADIRITSLSGGEVILAESVVNRFASGLRGRVLRPGEPEYDPARRIWNSMVDKRPALIVRCTGAADVMDAVAFAGEHGLLTAIRGGGHNIAGLALADGGLVIDLSEMRGIRVDAARRIAHCQAGAKWGDFDRETQAFALAAPGGIVSDTGVAGLTLGGGFGWLTRKHGFTCDNLLSADVINAEGRFLRASRTENQELFWGLCGGGANFGVVTSFEFELHPLGPQVFAGMVLHPVEKALELLSFFRDFSASAPRELASLALLRTAPALPALPSSVHGRKVAGIVACYAGPVEAGEEILRPIRAFGSPLADLFSPRPYRLFQQIFDAAQPPGRRYYWKSEYLPGLESGFNEEIARWCPDFSSPLSSVLIMHLGGAARDRTAADNAAANREAAYIANLASSWAEPGEDARHIEWTREFWQAIRPYSTGGTYLNFLTRDEGADRMRAAYGENYGRLLALKTKCDPGNFFRVNQNLRSP